MGRSAGIVTAKTTNRTCYYNRGFVHGYAAADSLTKPSGTSRGDTTTTRRPSFSRALYVHTRRRAHAAFKSVVHRKWPSTSLVRESQSTSLQSTNIRHPRHQCNVQLPPIVLPVSASKKTRGSPPTSYVSPSDRCLLVCSCSGGSCR